MAEEQRHYQDPIQAQLGERVTNLGRRQTDLEAEMRTGFRQIENSFASFTNETRNSIAALGTSISERSRPQWQALGVMVSVVVVLGGLVYWPIRESTNDLKAQDIETGRLIQSLTSETTKAIQNLAANTVSRQEMDWRAQRGVEDRNRTDAAVSDLRQTTVTRNEWGERNRAYDQQAADFNRRIEELRQDFGAVYGTRDVIQDMKRELDDLRRKQAPSG